MADTIHHRIRRRLAEVGKTQIQLAKAVGVSPQAVNQWLDHPTRKPKGPERELVAQIARFLETTESYLLRGDTEVHVHKSSIISVDTDQGRAVPFLPLSDLMHVTYDNSSANHRSRGSKVQTQHPVSSKAVAFALQDNSMEPRFSEQDIIIIDPEVSFDAGDYIAAHIKSADINIFRQFVYDGPDHRLLKAVNPQHRSYRFTHAEWEEDVVPLGTWVERREVNRKSLKRHT